MIQKLGNIALVIITVVVLVGAGFFLGQRTQSESATVKAVLADMTVHANQLERQQIETRNNLAQFALELRQVKNDEVDNILRKYGL